MHNPSFFQGRITKIAKRLSLMLFAVGGCSNPVSSTGDGLVAFINFDTGFSDASGHKVYGTPELVDGVSGKGMLCTGYQTGGVDVALGSDAPQINAARTLAAWVKVSTSGKQAGTQVIASYGYDGSGNIFALEYLRSAGGKFGMAYYNIDQPDVEGGYAASRDSFYHLAAVYDGGTTAPRLYMNGVLVAAASQPSHLATGGSTYLSIASSVSGDTVSTGGFCGVIDQVRLYNRALSAGQIQSLYQTKQ